MENIKLDEELYMGEDLPKLPPIDTSQFQPMCPADIIRILEPTIKKDDTNKLLVFLAMLNTYTEENQMNIAFIAPSSSGKSYIPLEVSTLFPKEDLIKLGSASPTAFYHEFGYYDKETNTTTVDLERKIVIYLDQPNIETLARLRALMSHDEKEIQSKITDRSEKNGTRTKTVILKGFSTFVFCTTGLRVDEQESTRFLLLSPEISQEKLREAIIQKIQKSSDSETFKKSVVASRERRLLIQRISAIKELHVDDIIIKSAALVESTFFGRTTKLKPRHQRDVSKIMNIAKSLALLNYWFREKDGFSIICTDGDVIEAFKIWDTFSEAQELNLPPYVYDIYKDVIVKEYEKKNCVNSSVPVGLTRGNILQAHYNLYGRYLADWQLRQIIQILETAGLIYQEPNVLDKRNILIYPASSKKEGRQNNSEVGGGVNKETGISSYPDNILDVFDGKLPGLDV